MLDRKGGLVQAREEASISSPEAIRPRVVQWSVWLIFALMLGAFHLLMRQYFLTANGTIGHDYSRVLPELLDGVFWFHNNGLAAVEWFSPGFCGGLPVFGMPDSRYYSVAQILAFAMDPIQSTYLTILLFASVGFWGFYCLLRGCFATSWQAAALAGTLFMFNGCFFHRMVVGHFPFHFMMLMPWISYFLMRPLDGGRRGIILDGAIAGSMLAYGVYSGMVHLLLPTGLALLGMAAIKRLVVGNLDRFWSRSLMAVGVSIGLSAAKLCAGLLVLTHLSRSEYTLPGFITLLGALHVLLSSLFMSPPNISDWAQPLLTQLEWGLDRHEWEFGVTLIPAVIVFAAMIGGFASPANGSPKRYRFQRLNIGAVCWFLVLFLVLILPLAVNIYTPSWNHLLKEIPIIKSSSTLLRWFVVYIPLVILLACAVFDRISPEAGHRTMVLVIALIAVVATNALKDRSFYANQAFYDPSPIIDAWYKLPRRVEGAYMDRIADDSEGHPREYLLLAPIDDRIAEHASQMLCRNPLFGYTAETFPQKTMHAGPVMDEQGGVLNLKNPACYNFPAENNCQPGDHFRLDQRDAALAFAQYRPFNFAVPGIQTACNVLTLLTLAALLATLAWLGCCGLLRRVRPSS